VAAGTSANAENSFMHLTRYKISDREPGKA
jgi:hypothetical protein